MQKGDRVICASPVGNLRLRNQIGTIDKVGGLGVTILFDEEIGGWNRGDGGPPRLWYCNKNKLTVIDDKIFERIVKAEKEVSLD